LCGSGIFYDDFATAIALPWQQFVEQQLIWGTGDAPAGLFGNLGLVVLSIALCMGIFTDLNGFTVSASRLLFAIGRAQILPKTFEKLHPKYSTPHVGIIFTYLMVLVAPWFGREVLLWIADMSATGVTVAYFIVALSLISVLSGLLRAVERITKAAYPPREKTLALLGTVSSVGFLGLLLIPGSPGFLGLPSWIALIVWEILGIVFYLVRGKKYQKIPKDKLDYLILGNSRSTEGGEEVATSDPDTAGTSENLY
jgi:amino acid transporter